MAKMSLDEQLDWFKQVASDRAAHYGANDRRGSINLIDATVVKRAASSVMAGSTVSIARLLEFDGHHNDLQVEVTQQVGYNPLRFGVDTLKLHCHGLATTHVDALNHVAYFDTWYGSVAVDGPQDDAPHVGHWGNGIMTRALHLDIPAVRGTEWVDPGEPVSGDDIESAIEAAGVTFEAGDALLIDMGRDRFEAAGHVVQSQWGLGKEARQSGVGQDGARWLADHDVSLLCWDFQDAVHPEHRRFCVHGLIWAAGLAIVDNCDFAELRSSLRARGGPAVGALTVAPLRVLNATGTNVNPIVAL